MSARGGSRAWRARWVRLGLLVWGLSVLGTGSSVASAPSRVGEVHIEIVIRDSTDARTMTLWDEGWMWVDVGGVAVFGKAFEGLHVGSENTAVIRLVSNISSV